MDEKLAPIFQLFRGRVTRVRAHLSSRDRRTWLGLLMLLYVVGGLGMGLVFSSRLLSTFSSQDQATVQSAPGMRGEGQVGSDIPVLIGPGSDEQYEIPTKAPSDPRVSFLLLGYGGGGHDGAYLTDSIMLAVADPGEKTLTLLSIPRDSWVPLLFGGKTAIYSKLNTAYAFAKDSSLYRERLERYMGNHAAGNFTADTVSRLLGLPVSNYLALDFEGFRRMIDAVGGIDVDVPNSFSASYPANDDPSIDASWTVVRFAKGVQHMSGERAIQFARAREVFDNLSEGTDFARSRRQRLIMEAFQKRLLEAGGLIRLPQILTIAARHVDTDYPLMEAAQLSQFILNWKDVQIYQTALTTANYLASGTGPEGAYVLIPSAADRSWTQIRAFARRLWENPAVGVEMADTRVVIANGTGDPGAATRLSTALTKLGYRVGIPLPGQVRAESRLIDRSGAKAKLLIAQLEKDLGIQFREVIEAPVGYSAELVLELGANDRSLADLSVPVDAEAPSSVFGIESFDGWLPRLPTLTPESTETPMLTEGSASPEALRTPAVTPQAHAIPPAKDTPTGPTPLPGAPTATAPLPSATAAIETTPISTPEPVARPMQSSDPTAE